MNTITAPRTRILMTSAAALALLVLPGTTTSAQATPDRAGHSYGVPTFRVATPTTSSRPCFLVRSHWNDAPDGPQPLC